MIQQFQFMNIGNNQQVNKGWIKKSKSFIFFFLFFFFVVIGTYLRIQNVISETFAFTYDVGRDLAVGNSITQNHKLLLIGPTSGLQGLFYGPWWYYFLVPFLFLSQGDPKSVVVAIATTGILAGILGYIVGEKIGGIFFGFLVGSFILIAPSLVGITSQIWHPNLAPFLVTVLIYLFFFFLLQEKKKWYGYFFFGVGCGFLLETEVTFAILMILSFAVTYFIINKKISFKLMIISFLGLLLVLFPRILFELRHGFLMTKSVFTFITNGSQSSKSIPILEKIAKSISEEFNLWVNTVGGGIPLLGIVLLIFSVATLIGFRKKIQGDFKQLLLLIGITIIIFFFGFVFLPEYIWSHYFVGLPILYIFFLAIPLTLLYQKKKFIYLAYLVVVILFFVSINPIRMFGSSETWEGDPSVYRNQLRVVDYIYMDANGKQFKYILYTPPVHDHTYKYLFSWYGKKTYGYTPVEKTGIMYVILEPDRENPQRLTTWLKERERDGVILQQKKLPGGVVVQKRDVR